MAEDLGNSYMYVVGVPPDDDHHHRYIVYWCQRAGSGVKVAVLLPQECSSRSRKDEASERFLMDSVLEFPTVLAPYWLWLRRCKAPGFIC